MKVMIKKRCFISLICFLIIGVFCLTSLNAQEYPTKPIDFIISFGAGGTTDISSRALIDRAGKFLGQPLVPINRPGATGAIGVTYIKNAKPDGYTIGLLTTSPAFVAPFLPDVTYDILRDFTPIAHYGEYLFLCAVRSDKPWKTWKDVIDCVFR
jgi:tripartite-type tricarboxylate transporter receptor subunit TctC